MPLPIRPLPIVESWDCNSCGRCCYGTIFALSGEDLEKLRRQDWPRRAGFEGKKVITPFGLFPRRYHLARRRDGACVFLQSDNRCAIHAEFGEAAKPHTCRMFPFQLTPMEDFAWVSFRRFCPVVAAGEGRGASEYMPAVQQLVQEAHLAEKPASPPAVLRGDRRNWDDVTRSGETLARLLRDERFPLVRRIAHALKFCELLSSCRLAALESEDVTALLSMLQESAVSDGAVSAVFRGRRPPGRAAGLLFRQTALEYLRLHPDYVIQRSMQERWRLIRAAMAFARGKGPLPFLHKAFPAGTFESLEAPLGSLSAETLKPLVEYFEATAVSLNYLMLTRAGWSLVEALRGLALSFAVAMWVLRLVCGGRAPTKADMLGIVGMLDRANGYAALCGTRHRRRIASLERMHELTRLAAWYAR